LGGEDMKRINEEVSTLITVEQHLLNAAGAIRVAEHRLGGHAELHEDLREILRALDGAVGLTRKTKHALLREWQSMLPHQPAA